LRHSNQIHLSLSSKSGTSRIASTVDTTGTRSTTVSTGEVIYASGAGSITDTTTTFSSTADGSTHSPTNTTNLLTPNSNRDEVDGNLDMILIIVGTIAGALVMCGLLVLVIFILRRRKSNSLDEDEKRDNYVSLVSIKSNANSDTQYQSISSPYQPLGQSQTGAPVAISDEKHAPGATKSWEINYSELKMLETVGEGSFGTVHRAIYRHQQVAVKQLKKKINQKEVRNN
jgi:hypothetical protein